MNNLGLPSAKTLGPGDMTATAVLSLDGAEAQRADSTEAVDEVSVLLGAWTVLRHREDLSPGPDLMFGRGMMRLGWKGLD